MIEKYLAVITLVYAWTSIFNKKTKVNDDKVYLVYEFKYFTRVLNFLDRKPINCNKCLSWWVGLTLYICTGELLFLSLPLPFITIIK